MNDSAQPNEAPSVPSTFSRLLDWLRRFWLFLGWLAFGALCVRFILYQLPPLSAVAFVLTFAAFCFPGWALLSILWGSQRATNDPELWLWGGMIGIAISCWVAMLEGFYTGVPGGLWVIGLDAVAMIVWFFLARRNGLTPIPIRPWRFGERVIWQVVLLWVLLFVGRAYIDCGFAGEDGIVRYPAAFASQFLDMVTQTTSLGLQLPPLRFDLAGATAPVGAAVLLLPAVGRNWMDPYGPVGAWVILSNLFVALGFAGVVYTVVRTLIIDLRRQMIALGVIFFCTSFYWVVPLLQPSAIGVHSLWWQTTITPFINDWALVAPQTLMTLALWLVLTLWLKGSRQPPSILSVFGVGMLAGIMAAIDPQAGWLTAVAGLIWIVVLLMRFPNDLPRLSVGLLLYVMGVIAGTFPIWWLGAQTPNPLSRIAWWGSGDGYLSLPARLIILFGPLLAVMVCGFYRHRDAYRLRDSVVGSVFTVCALVLILHVRTLDDPSYGVAVGRLALFALAVVGVSLSLAWEINWRDYLTMAAGVCVLVAVPSVFSDWHDTSLNDQRTDLAITAEDWIAAERARDVLPADAIVQSWPEYGDSGQVDPHTYAINWGIHLALRPAAAGPVRGDEDSLAAARRSSVRAIFAAQRPDSTYARAQRMGIEYLYAGPHALRRFPRLHARLSAAPTFFDPVFEQDSSGLYRLLPIPDDSP